MKYLMVPVAMSAMMRKNPTRKAMLKVTMSTITKISTILQKGLKMTGQVFPFRLYKLLAFWVFCGLHSVAASSWIGLHDRVFGSGTRANPDAQHPDDTLAPFRGNAKQCNRFVQKRTRSDRQPHPVYRDRLLRIFIYRSNPTSFPSPPRVSRLHHKMCQC